MKILTPKSQRNANVLRHYFEFVKKQTAYYEYLNRHSETITHKATPEETKYYIGLLKSKPSVHKLKLKDNKTTNDKP